MEMVALVLLGILTVAIIRQQHRSMRRLIQDRKPSPRSRQRPSSR
jgi:hypothetical protein